MKAKVKPSEQLILDNIPLIYKCIKDLHCHWKTEDEFQEYYSAGLEGLIIGSKTYKPSKAKNSTYLYTCIKNAILTRMQSLQLQKRKINAEIMVSLNQETYCGEGTLADITQDDTINVEEEAEKEIQLKAIIKELNSMPEKDALPIKMHYGLGGSTPKTYKEIAKLFGVTSTTIRSRVERGVQKLKEKSPSLESKYLSKPKKQ